MIAETILAVASFGTDLLGAAQVRRDARHTIRLARSEDRLRQTMISRQAGADSRERVDRFRQVVGTQNAAIASMGVVGGRTARLFRQQAQVRFQDAQAGADAQTSAQRSQSRMRRSQAIAGARRQQFQSTVNLLGSAIELGSTINTAREQRAVD